MSSRISNKAKIKFIKANYSHYTNYRKAFVNLARATFRYSPNTVDIDIIMSFDKAWKGYQDGK